jgi:hypothetical protein
MIPVSLLGLAACPAGWCSHTVPTQNSLTPPGWGTLAPSDLFKKRTAIFMDQSQLNWLTNFIWNIADDVLRDVYVRGKYRDVILPMIVLRRLDAVHQPVTARHSRW